MNKSIGNILLISLWSCAICMSVSKPNAFFAIENSSANNYKIFRSPLGSFHADKVGLKSSRSKRMTDAKKRRGVEHVFYLGSKAELPCFPEKMASTSTFTWQHHRGQQLKDKRYKVSPQGKLTISRVEPRDFGEFLCTAYDTIEEKSKEALHKVTVVQLPTVGIHAIVRYDIEHCDKTSEEMASEHVTKVIKDKVCLEKECKLGSVHGACHQKAVRFERDFRVHSVLTVTVPITVPEVPTDTCDGKCVKNKLDDIEKKIKETVEKAITEATEELELPHTKGKLKPTSFLTKTDMKLCDPGFQLIKEQCIPCTPGHFLSDDKCERCPKDQYVAKFAATSCHHCENDEKTIISGATSVTECREIGGDFWMVIFVLVLFLFLFGLLFCYWTYWLVRLSAGDSAFGRTLDTICKCATCTFDGAATEKNSVTFNTTPNVSKSEELVDDADKESSEEQESPSGGPPPPPPPPPLPSIRKNPNQHTVAFFTLMESDANATGDNRVWRSQSVKSPDQYLISWRPEAGHVRRSGVRSPKGQYRHKSAGITVSESAILSRARAGSSHPSSRRLLPSVVRSSRMSSLPGSSQPDVSAPREV